MRPSTRPEQDDPFIARLLDILRSSPDARCICSGDRQYCLAELVAAVEDWAERLSAMGLQSGEPVIIEVPHSFELIAAICGVLVAGGLVVPVDPALSTARKRAIFQDVGARFAISSDPADATPVVRQHDAQPRRKPELAFLVYTSGSTGMPKGVEIGKVGYLARLEYITAGNPGQANDADLLWTPSSFIGMLDEVFFPLMLGVPIVIGPERIRTDPEAFANLIAEQKVTTFRITPSLLNVILTADTAPRLDSVRAIFCSGETLPAEVQNKVHRLLDTTLIGFFGATEAPGVGFHVFDPTSETLTQTVCTPQPFAKIEIVDQDGKPAQHGQTGEVLIGGFAVAEGYWNRPDLTAEKFVRVGQDRFYRTGDLGRWTEAGQFEILGRADMAEVNIRGVRVSVSEIRNGLLHLPAIRDAFVTAHNIGEHRDPVLVAHLVTTGHEPISLSKHRAELCEVMPVAALPTHSVFYGAFPLMENGKLDLQTMKDKGFSEIERSVQRVANAPLGEGIQLSPQARTVLPIILASVEELLSVQDLSGAEDFFELGGDSLKAVELALLISKRIGTELESSAIFNSTSLSEIAETVTSGHMAEAGPCRLIRHGAADLPPLFTINATGNYTRLAKALTYEGPVYNLNIFGLTNRFRDRLNDVSLADLSDQLAAEVRQCHPAGPWSVMAFCQDGCLAVEVGRRLHSGADESCDLILIDTFFTDHGSTLKMSIMRLIDFGPGYYLHRLKRKFGLGAGLDRFNAHEDTSPAMSAALLDKSKNDGQLYRRYSKFFMHYAPEPYPGDVHLLTSGEWRHAKLGAASRLSPDGLNVVPFPGLHGQIFMDGKIHHLAEAVDKSLGPLQRTVR
ncbi:MAG: AMP-binding protein [Pseudomonadota bacterium]